MHIDRSSATAMACYTAEDVFEEDGVALDSLCMEGSDELEAVEVVQNGSVYSLDWTTGLDSWTHL